MSPPPILEQSEKPTEDPTAGLSKFAFFAVLVLILFLAFRSNEATPRISESICMHTSIGCTPIIKKGTALPASFTYDFGNMVANQTAVRISLYKGESKKLENNKPIGNFDLPITPLPRGAAHLEVTVTVSKEKQIQLFTHDKSSGDKRSFNAGTLNNS